MAKKIFTILCSFFLIILPYACVCSFQADELLDSAMTYTLFDWVKENYDDLIADQTNIPQVVTQVLFQNFV